MLFIFVNLVYFVVMNVEIMHHFVIKKAMMGCVNHMVIEVVQ